MINLELDKIQVLSSLPGRLRANVSGLLRNEQIAFGIKNILVKSNGIFSVHTNKNTGNVLIFYDTKLITQDKVIVLIERSSKNSKGLIVPKNANEESLLKIFFSTLNPISLFRKRYPERIYKNEYIISKKIMTTSTILSGIILLFTSNINKALSTFILGYPGILFSIGLTSLYYASTKLKENNIYVKTNDSLMLLKDTNKLLIENNIFQSKFHKYTTVESHLNKNDIQKLVILGELNNPVSKELEYIVHNIRILGISDISIIGNDPKGILEYISYHLGINKLDTHDFEIENKHPITNKANDSSLALLLANESFEKNNKYPYCDLVMCIYKNNSLNILKSDINLEYADIDKIPLIIKLSHFCGEINVQTENIAIALNTVGMLLVTLDYFNPLHSIIFYGLNTLLMTLTLKLRFISSKIFYKEPGIRYDHLID